MFLKLRISQTLKLEAAFASRKVVTFILPIHTFITSLVIKETMVTTNLLGAQPMSAGNFKSYSWSMGEQDLNTGTLSPELINTTLISVSHQNVS